MCRVVLLFALLCVAACRCDDVEYDTIVVGLGAAGTAAAAELARGGRAVLALEARDRLGGRVWTTDFGGGTVELGAEWIHGIANSSVYKSATSSGVPVKEQDYNDHLLRKGGEPPKEALKQIIDDVIRLYMEHEETVQVHESVGQYFTKRIRELARDKYPSLTPKDIDDVLYFFNIYLSSYEASDNWDELDARSEYVALDGHQTVGWGRSGYRTLFDILLNKYNNGSGFPNLDIRLNSEVTSIQWSTGAGVTVSTKDHSYHAKHVIVTLPLGVLKERHSSLFSPPLTAEKVAAIEVLPFGTIGKIVLAFDRPWWDSSEDMFNFLWDKEEAAKVPAEWRWITRIVSTSCPLGANNVITLWTQGDTAKLVEILPSTRVVEGSLRLLRHFMPANVTIPQPTGMMRTGWFADPLSRGTYSFDGIRSSASPRARRALLAPLRDDTGTDRVLFAGEATHPTRYSTVHGAVDSGYREARRLLGTLTPADQYQ